MEASTAKTRRVTTPAGTGADDIEEEMLRLARERGRREPLPMARTTEVLMRRLRVAMLRGE